MRRLALVLVLTIAASAAAVAMAPPDDRAGYLRMFRQIMPPVPSFTQWLDRTGELPPDFRRFPRNNDLPDPLRFLDGRQVRTVDDWNERRSEILKLQQAWVLGRFPPRPSVSSATVLEEKVEDGWTVRSLRLEFGTDRRGTLRATVAIPQGNGPFPVMINPSLGNTARGIGGEAMKRGYILAGFAGNDRENDASAYVELFPEHDFADLPRRAWSSQLLLDYLFTLPQVDRQRIALNGYSRDGKMALIAAALDERIAAVIPASTGVGGVMPWRSGSERGFGESIESTTRNFPGWFAPQLRFFSGREDRLPVDGNLLVALVAPRAVLITYGNNDEVSQPLPMEQSYRSALRAYEFLGRPAALGILHSPGYHGANDVQATMDWVDIQFGRSTATWSNELIYPWNHEHWFAQVGEKLDESRFPVRRPIDVLRTASGGAIRSAAAWEGKAAAIRQAVEQMLGSKAPGILERPFPLPKLGDPSQPAAPVPAGRGTTTTTPITLFDDIHARKAIGNSYGWPAASEGASRRKILIPPSTTFGAIEADLFLPGGIATDAKLLVIIWLHGYSSSLGYSWVYHYDLHPVLALAKAGYAVLAFDQSGFGSRQREAAAFYNSYPRWSRMGQMVADVGSAIDVLSGQANVDPGRVYLFGFSMGGNVALHAAALDKRVKGVVSINGFTPMRSDTPEKGTGGIARYFREHDLVPRLGAFAGKEARIPYDYDELIAAIAPRPVYVLAARLDRDADPDDVSAAVNRARDVYRLHGSPESLVLDQPVDYNRLTLEMQDRVIAWMKGRLN